MFKYMAHEDPVITFLFAIMQEHLTLKRLQEQKQSISEKSTN